jgi:hypothetical protein
MVLQVAAGRRIGEGAQQTLVGFARHAEARPRLLHLQPGAVHQLPARGLALAEGAGDFVVVGVEHFAQQEGGTRLGREALQHREEGDGDVVGAFEQLFRRVGPVGERGLGHPGADVVLALDLGGTQPVDREARDDGDEPGFGAVEAVLVRVVPAKPGVLHDFFGFRDGAEHAVGDALKAAPMAVEGQCGVVHVRGSAERVEFLDACAFDAVCFWGCCFGAGSFRARATDTGYSPPRMSPASLLLYFAAGSTRYQSHLGTLLVCGRSTTAPHNAHVDGVLCAAK